MKCHMSKPQKPPDILMSQFLQSEDMPETPTLKQKSSLQEDINIGLMTQVKTTETRISMQESLVENNIMIFSDKSYSSEEMFQTHPFSLILDLVSITTEKTLKPFFNNLSKVKSKKLWLPIKTDSLESDSPSFSGSFSSLDQNLFLWTQNNFLKQQEMKCLMTSWKLSLSSPQDIMDSENIEKQNEKVLRCKKIPFIPKGDMILFIRKNFDVFEKYYNLAIDEINRRFEERKEEFNNLKTCIMCKEYKEINSWLCKDHRNSKIKWNLNINKKSLREKIKIKNDDVDEETKEVLYDVRDNALGSAISAYKTSSRLLINKHIRHFTLKKKENKILSKRIVKMTKNSLTFKHGNIYLNPILFSGKYKDSKFFERDRILYFRKNKHYEWIINTFPDGLDCAFDIFKDSDGTYYLIIPFYENKTKIENNKIISLDPGVRTFQTGYDPEGKIIECGEKSIKKIKKIFNSISKFDSLLNTRIINTIPQDELIEIKNKIKEKSYPKPKPKQKSKNRKEKEKNGTFQEKDIKKKCLSLEKRNYWRSRTKLYKKCNGEINNLHNKVGCFLTKNYKNILLPEFQVSKMIRKIRKESSDSNRVINSRTAHMMQCLSFYKFKIKLKDLCEKRGCNLYIVDESYTSKTCGRCGELNNELKGNKVFTCKNCNLIIDRDWNGARNILLKNL